MRDEESDNTPARNLVGPIGLTKGHGSASKDSDDLDDLDIDLPEDFDLVPAVRDYGVHAPPKTRPPPPSPASPSPPPPAFASPSVAPPLPPRAKSALDAGGPSRSPSAPLVAPEPAPSPRPLRAAPHPRAPSAREEATVEVARPSEAELRARTTLRPPRSQTGWGRSGLWIVGSAILGGVVTFLAVRARTPAPAEALAPRASPVAAAPAPGGRDVPSTAPPSSAMAASSPVATSPLGSPAAPATGSPASGPNGEPPPRLSSSAALASGAATAGPSAARPAPAPAPVASASRIELLAAARQARQEGKPARARSVYQGILAKDADDFDALTGLGDLAYEGGKYSDARAFYIHALAVNPSHRPAMLGLADTLWDLDDRDAARARYRDLLKRAPPSAYPARVESRAAL